MDTKQKLLQLLQDEAEKLDNKVEARIKYRGIVTSKNEPPSQTIVTDNGERLTVEVFARPSIRLRDAGFGRYYNKGNRIDPPPPDYVPFERRKYKLINRPMFALVHNIQELGIKIITRDAITTLKDNIK